MATSVEAVHIRDLKKGQILTTIQKNKQTILRFFKSMTIRNVVTVDLHFKLTQNTIKHPPIHFFS